MSKSRCEPTTERLKMSKSKFKTTTYNMTDQPVSLVPTVWMRVRPHMLNKSSFTSSVLVLQTCTQNWDTPGSNPLLNSHYENRSYSMTLFSGCLNRLKVRLLNTSFVSVQFVQRQMMQELLSAAQFQTSARCLASERWSQLCYWPEWEQILTLGTDTTPICPRVCVR